ncbi:hypothetical protein COO60DRAFT_446960 [Scenedesmus sp. NREL 46B-D3]|nr:hypothetical protein COO60DRAFT_446960 [Scenedesmus sp. NREL 46B-D3]
MAAALVPRGRAAPLSAAVLLQQPEGGSPLHAGGTKPAGFWSGSAVLSAGKVYTVDRVDVADTAVPPLAAVVMPSLMWTEISVQTTMSGAGDCAQTEAWGSHWNWTRDWSADWGTDFDQEWKENREAAEEMDLHVKAIEAAVRQAVAEATANCSAAANALALLSAPDALSNTTGEAHSSQQQVAPAVDGISDGSVGTVMAPQPAQRHIIAQLRLRLLLQQQQT